MTINASNSAGDPGPVLALARSPGLAGRLLARRPWLVEATWAVVFAVGQTMPLLAGAVESWGRGVVDVVVLLVGLLVLLCRRAHPWALFGVGLVVTLLLLPTTGDDALLLVALGLYTLAVQRGARSAWSGFVMVIVATGGLMALAASGLVPVGSPLTSEPGSGPSSGAAGTAATALVLMLLAMVTLIGTNVGARRRYVTALVERAADLERERDQRARLAVAEERGRIAREMHDIVAHSLSVMVALADGASQTRDPGRARTATLQVAETGRTALVEMKRVLQVLNPDDAAADLHPQPGLEQLSELVEEFRRAGLPVTSDMSPHLTVSGVAELTIYRLVQESLTNVLRHARQPHNVHVRVHATSDGRHLQVEVTDDGAATPPAAVADRLGRAGRGLIGMRERLRSVHGRVLAGPLTDGGWRVSALVPVQDATAALGSARREELHAPRRQGSS